MTGYVTVTFTEMIKTVEQRDKFGGRKNEEIRSSLLATFGW